MRIFVTGGTGFIGSHLIRQAVADGHEVVALKRPSAKTKIPLDKSPHWVVGELADNWSNELSSCDSLIHLAAYGVASGCNDWDNCFKINLIDSLKLWRQAVSVGITRFVIIGSCFEYGRTGDKHEAIPVSAPLEPTNAYAASKAAATMAALALAIEFSLKLVVVRPFHVYGEGEASQRFWPSLVSAAKTGQNLPMTSGKQIRDFQPVEEAALQILNCLASSEENQDFPQIVNLGTGHPQTLLEFASKEWKRLNAKGRIMAGSMKHRENEVWKYIPEIHPTHLS